MKPPASAQASARAFHLWFSGFPRKRRVARKIAAAFNHAMATVLKSAGFLFSNKKPAAAATEPVHASVVREINGRREMDATSTVSSARPVIVSHGSFAQIPR